MVNSLTVHFCFIKLILDLGHFKFGNDETQESLSVDNLVMDDLEDDGTDKLHVVFLFCY